MCVRAHAHWFTCAMVDSWRSENSFQKLVLSFHHGFQRLNLGFQGCKASAFTHRASLLVQIDARLQQISWFPY